MAYVVARRNGRFEIRESVHTLNGPRARSLVNFAELTDDVLERARQRATRPFDEEAVRESARLAAKPEGAPVRARAVAGRTAATVPRHEQPEMRRFVEATRRMVRSLEHLPEPSARRDPGDAFIGLIEVVANVTAFGPARPREPLRFPPLARLRAARNAAGEDIVTAEQ